MSPEIYLQPRLPDDDDSQLGQTLTPTEARVLALIGDYQPIKAGWLAYRLTSKDTPESRNEIHVLIHSIRNKLGSTAIKTGFDRKYRLG